jgi:hypothetical protein
MTIKEFKHELRGDLRGDEWGYAMSAWFDAVAVMYERKLRIPEKWRYKNGGDVIQEDSSWFESFRAASDEQIQAIAHLLARYCEMLRRKGKSY